MDFKEKINLMGVAGVYLYMLSSVTSKAGINIGTGLMVLSSLFLMKNLKKDYIEKEQKYFLFLIILIPIFDFFSPGGWNSTKITLEKSYRFLPLFLAPIFLDSLKKIKNVLFLLAISVGINCIYGLYLYKEKMWNFTLRYQSITTYMDSAHILTSLSFLILPFLIIQVKNKQIKSSCFLGSIYILDLICILLGQSRGAWLALIGTMIIFLFFSLNKKIFLIISIIIILLSGILIKSENLNNNQYIRRFKSIKEIDDDSPKIRLLMWEASVEIYKNNFIFGVGKDNSPKYFLQYFDKNDSYKEVTESGINMMKSVAKSGNTHNMYFENLVNMGSLFLGLLLFWIYILIEQVKFLIKLKKDNEYFWIILGTVCVTFSYYLTGMTEAAWGTFFKRNIYLVGLIIYFSIKKIKFEKNKKI